MIMKKLILLKCAIALTLLMTCCQNRLFVLSTTSPNHTYTINLVESLYPPGEPYKYMVGLKIFRAGNLIADNSRFSGSDDFDRRFGDEYPEHQWMSENLLRLGRKTSPSQYDTIVIRNTTNSVITYFTALGKTEMFMLFDIQPDSVIKLNAQPQTDRDRDLSWIAYSGQLAGGKEIPPGGVNFKIHGKYIGPACYCVNIKNGEVLITSSNFEAVKYSSGNEVITPVDITCTR